MRLVAVMPRAEAGNVKVIELLARSMLPVTFAVAWSYSAPSAVPLARIPGRRLVGGKASLPVSGSASNAMERNSRPARSRARRNRGTWPRIEPTAALEEAGDDKADL